MRFVDNKGLSINEAYKDILSSNGLDDFTALMGFEGGRLETEKSGKRSVVNFELTSGGGKLGFYLKRHFEKGSKGLKSLLGWSGAEDARNEWDKMILLSELGFHTMTPVAFGCSDEGSAPASLTLTEEIRGAVRVEDHIPALAGEEGGVQKKRELIRRLAVLASDFHGRGLNHQDFYLGHFFIRPGSDELFIVDLQRVQKREAPVKRWVLKDLSQLAFSASITDNITRTDMFRFALAYFDTERLGAEDKAMVRTIISKVDKIAKHTEKLLARRKGSK